MIRYLFLPLTCLITSSAAAASGLPAATSFVECLVNGAYVTDPTSCVTRGDNASVNLEPVALAHADASNPGGFSSPSTNGFAILSYSFQVVGGHAGDLVPLDIDTVLQTFVTNPLGAAFAEISIKTSQGTASVAVCSTSKCASPSFVGELQINALFGEVGSLSLEVQAGASYGAEASGGSATADPKIFVDPAFANASAYSIVLSDGVGNGIASVPEPASGWLLVAGLAGLAGWRRLGGSGPV